MKVILLLCACALASCARKPVAVPIAAPAPEAIIVALPRPAVPAVPKPVARILNEFGRIEESELHAVTRPTVTPEFVRAVHAAHLEARHAVTELEREKLRPSATTLGHAQQAVSKLGEVLAQVPGDEP